MIPGCNEPSLSSLGQARATACLRARRWRAPWPRWRWMRRSATTSGFLSLTVYLLLGDFGGGCGSYAGHGCA